MIIWYIVAGVVSGIVAGMGMGGGTLLIPILTIFFKIEQHLSQGINLLVFLPTAIVSLVIHCKNKLVNFKVGIPIMLSGVVASVAGSLLATTLSNDVLKRLFGLFLLLVGVWQVLTIFLFKKKAKASPKFKFVGFLKL